MNRVGLTLRGVKPQDLLASAVLVVEALYFIIATAIITGFGVIYAQGNLPAQGLLGIASLPLIAVGAFAVWSLALLHVLPPTQGAGKSRTVQTAGDGSTKQVARVGFFLVVLTHVVYGVMLLGQNRLRLGTGILVLAALLMVCCLSQFRAQSKTRPARVTKFSPGETAA